MEKPDLHEMDATARGLYAALEEFASTLEEAKWAAEGVFDDEIQDVRPDSGNGDRMDLFDEARKNVVEATKSMADVRRVLAAQQGFREFEAKVEA